MDQAACGNADAAIAAVGFDEGRIFDLRQRIAGLQQDFTGHRNPDRLGRGTHQSLVVTKPQRDRSIAAVGDAEHFEISRQVGLERRIVAKSGVAKIEREFRRLVTQACEQRLVIVEIMESVLPEFGERRFEPLDLVEIVRGETAAGLAAVGQARISEQYAYRWSRHGLVLIRRS